MYIGNFFINITNENFLLFFDENSFQLLWQKFSFNIHIKFFFSNFCAENVFQFLFWKFLSISVLKISFNFLIENFFQFSYWKYLSIFVLKFYLSICVDNNLSFCTENFFPFNTGNFPPIFFNCYAESLFQFFRVNQKMLIKFR